MTEINYEMSYKAWLSLPNIHIRKKNFHPDSASAISGFSDTSADPNSNEVSPTGGYGTQML
jgi:hypothetical protein